MFSQYTIPQLKSIIKQYNIHTKITNYSKMRKDLLILEIEKYLTIDNKITVKENNFDIIIEPEKKIKKEAEKIKKNVEVEVEKTIKKEAEKIKKNIEVEKTEPQLLSLGEILKLMKKLDKQWDTGVIIEDKDYWVNSLIYSLRHKYDNYTPEMNKKYAEIYRFLGTKLFRMKLSRKQIKKLDKRINIYYTQQEELKEKKKYEKYFHK
jgi:hypothetical protein